MPPSTRIESSVGVLQIRRAVEGGPVLAGVPGVLDLVARDTGTPRVHGGLPLQVDPRLTAGLGHELRRRTGLLRVSGVVSHVGGVAVPPPVFRGDPIVPGLARGEAGVVVRRGLGAGIRILHRPGLARVVGNLDLVAVDRRAAVIGGRIPRKVDLRLADGGRFQAGRRIGNVEGGGEVDVGGVPHAELVDGGDVVVVRRPPGKVRVRIGRVPRIHRVGPVVPVERDPDPVPGNRRAAVVVGRSPGEADPRGVELHGHEGLRPPGGNAVGGCVRHVGRTADGVRVDRRDLVVPGGVGLDGGVVVHAGRRLDAVLPRPAVLAAVGGPLDQIPNDLRAAVVIGNPPG